MDIERLKELKQQIKGAHDGINGDDLNLLYNLLPYHVVQTIITALQEYQPWVSVEVEKPESERPVLLLCQVKPMGRKYICVGFYATPKSVIIPCDDESNYEYDEETDEFYLVEGFYENIYNWGDYTSVAINDFVIGWKSLPAKGD